MLDGSWQKEVARKLGVCEEAYLGWEHDRTKPAGRYIPVIIEHLGYDPFPKLEPQTLGQQIAYKRRLLGLSREKLAKLLVIDEGTLRRYEQNRREPVAGTRVKIARFLGEAE